MPLAWRAWLYRCRPVSSPALTKMTAIGGITSATTDITTAAVTEKIRTTVQARATSVRHEPIITRYQRLRVMALIGETAQSLHPYPVPSG
jgi:hypothetical protein